MKKRIEHRTHIPIHEQSWQGLSGAKDSVSFQEGIPTCINEF
jgi:hypothetical protein